MPDLQVETRVMTASGRVAYYVGIAGASEKAGSEGLLQ
jgi:hypothetical protein